MTDTDKQADIDNQATSDKLKSAMEQSFIKAQNAVKNFMKEAVSYKVRGQAEVEDDLRVIKEDSLKAKAKKLLKKRGKIRRKSMVIKDQFGDDADYRALSEHLKIFLKALFNVFIVPLGMELDSIKDVYMSKLIQNEINNLDSGIMCQRMTAEEASKLPDIEGVSRVHFVNPKGELLCIHCPQEYMNHQLMRPSPKPQMLDSMDQIENFFDRLFTAAREVMLNVVSADTLDESPENGYTSPTPFNTKFEPK